MLDVQHNELLTLALSRSVRKVIFKVTMVKNFFFFQNEMKHQENVVTRSH